MAFEAELASYVAAGYALIGIETVEETRFLGNLKALYPEVPVLALTATQPADIHGILDRIEATEGRHLFVLLDYGVWLEQPLVARRLRSLMDAMPAQGQTLFLVSQGLNLPHDLAQETVVLQLPLPDASQLETCLNDALSEAKVDLDTEVRGRALRALQGLPLRAAERACRRALGPEGLLGQGDVSGLIADKRRSLGKSDQLTLVEETPGLDAIGGLDRLKNWLIERAGCFSDEAREFGLPIPKGLLLVGVQGCGKSLTAKAVSGIWGLPLIRLDFSALYTYGASPEQNLREALRLSEALEPVVLWVDELDKAFQGLGAGTSQDDSLRRVFASFITWMQEKTSSVFVVATANSVEHLPPELLRKGRFDEVFFVDLPSPGERETVLGIHLEAHGRSKAGFDLPHLAQLADGFSGAELEQAVISGLYRAFRNGRDLNTEDVGLAIETTVPLSRMAEDAIKALREWARTRARRASTDTRLTDLWKKKS